MNSHLKGNTFIEEIFTGFLALSWMQRIRVSKNQLLPFKAPLSSWERKTQRQRDKDELLS